jgi:hypothetical protein
MSTAQSGSKSLSSATRPTERWAVFGPPPLLGSEKLTDYEALFARISQDVTPVDILEEIWMADFVDLTWEIFRLRRLKAGLVDGSAIKLLDNGQGEPVVDRFDARTLSQDLNQLEQMNHMTALAEARRNNALHEIERHRATFANAVRRNVHQIEERECQVVDAEPVEESDRA